LSSAHSRALSPRRGDLGLRLGEVRSDPRLRRGAGRLDLLQRAQPVDPIGVGQAAVDSRQHRHHVLEHVF